ncbi:hypothetical protein [Actinoallomurus acaciae]|uniref:Uncharacterized protein n=1 Tax=Actinoallomurus acaciae TaxID=502577 RepID=A0ABV5YQ57_9ACTN
MSVSEPDAEAPAAPGPPGPPGLLAPRGRACRRSPESSPRGADIEWSG